MRVQDADSFDGALMSHPSSKKTGGKALNASTSMSLPQKQMPPRATPNRCPCK